MVASAKYAGIVAKLTGNEEASKCRRCASDNAVCEQITDEDIQAQGQSFVIELESLCATREEFDEGHGRYAEHPNTGKSYRRPDHALVEQWYLAHALSVLKAQVEHEAKEEEQKRLARESRKQRKLARRTLAMQTDIASSLKEITLTLKRQQRVSSLPCALSCKLTIHKLLASLYAKR